MAILENVIAQLPQTTTGGTSQRRPFGGVVYDKPRAKVWGNIGYMEHGEFVSLPLGCAIDTMEPASVTGQNAAVVTMNRRRNKGLTAMQILGSKMKPGETMFVPNIVFQLRRVNEDLEIVSTENELEIDDILALLTPKKEEPKLEAVQPSKADLQAQLEALQKALAASE